MPSTPRIVDLSGITAVAYTRVSTEDQASERKTSLADQRAAIAALAAKLGVTVGHVFEDAGASGAWEKRPEFDSLIASCKASPRKTAAFVLVLNDSRWARFEDSEDSTYFRREIGRVGWKVQFAEMDEIQDDAVRPILRALAQSQASLYRRNLKANVKRGCRGQAEQGYWQAKAPFGYARLVVFPPGRERTLGNNVPKATDEKLILVPIADDAAIVRAVFARYVAGAESIDSLLGWLTTEHPSRSWTRAAVLRMLSNPAYVGDVVWGRMSVEPGKRSTRSSADWYGKRDAHEAIIGRNVFADAQARLALNRHRTRGVRSDWVLSGVVRCRCGRNLIGFGPTGPRGKNPVYACSTRGSHKQRRCEHSGMVLKSLLERTAIAMLSKEIGSVAHRRAMAAALDAAHTDLVSTGRRRETITRELAALRQRKQRIVSAIEAGALSPIDAADRMAAIRLEQERLNAELDRADRSSEDWAAWRDALAAEATDFSKMAAELQGPQLRELIQRWVDRAEFNTTTRELTMEIRRVPASALRTPLTNGSAELLGFDTEGKASAAKPRKRSGLDATITRVVIVGRRRSA